MISPKPPPHLLATLLSLPVLLATLVTAHYSKGTASLTLPKETAIQVAGTAMTLIVGLSVWVVSLLYKDYKEKKEYRRLRVQAWRDAIAGITDDGDFRKSVVCSEVRPHLGKETLKILHGDSIHIYVGAYSGVSVLIDSVLKDIARLESKWGLI